MQRWNSLIKTIKIIFDKEKRIMIRVLAVIILISASFSYTRVEEPETVYYFDYGQMVENLGNLIYNEREDQYIANDTFVFLQLDMERNLTLRNYLYLDFYTSSGEEMSWKLQFLNGKNKVLAEQEIILHQGKNEVIILGKRPFRKVKFLTECEMGETFRLENVELRIEGRDFLVKRFLLIFMLTFMILLGIVMVLYYKVADTGYGQLLAETRGNIDAFLDVLGDTISWHFTRNVKRMLRSGIFLSMLLYLTYFQTKGITDMVSYMSMHMWIMGGLLLILAGLCHEKRKPEKDSSVFRFITMLFIALVIVSDFFVSRKFRYAGFGMIFMGGFFARSWRSMKHPEELLEEFKGAYKIYYVLGLCFCLIARPYTDGICYSGYMIDSSSFGIAMLIAAVVFLSDFVKEDQYRSNKGIDNIKYIANGVCAVTALYLAWKTQLMSIIIIEVTVFIVCFMFWFIEWMRGDGRNKKRKLYVAFVSVIAGAVVSLCIQKMLYTFSYHLGTQKTFIMDVIETMDVSIRQAVGECGWKRFFLDKLLICKLYLQRINLMGYSYLTKFHNESVWPANSIVMNLFRYGMTAGIAYGTMIVLYLLKAVKTALWRNNFFLAGIAIVCVLAGMMEVTEMPFLHLNWYMFWFGVCYLLVVCSNGTSIEI